MAALASREKESTVKNRKENTVRKLRRLYRIGALAGTILLPISAVLATGIPEASAGIRPAAAPSGNQFCYYNNGTGWVCPNAWGGGPWVNLSTNNNTQNNDFTIIYESDGYVELQDTGDNAWSGKCIGDAYNESGDAEASLDPCGGGGASAGWGTQFILDPMCVANIGGGTLALGYGFESSHWPNGWLGPAGSANGSHFYLNKPSEYCYAASPAAG